MSQERDHGDEEIVFQEEVEDNASSSGSNNLSLSLSLSPPGSSPPTNNSNQQHNVLPSSTSNSTQRNVLPSYIDRFLIASCNPTPPVEPAELARLFPEDHSPNPNTNNFFAYNTSQQPPPTTTDHHRNNNNPTWLQNALATGAGYNDSQQFLTSSTDYQQNNNNLSWFKDALATQQKLHQEGRPSSISNPYDHSKYPFPFYNIIPNHQGSPSTLQPCSCKSCIYRQLHQPLSLHPSSHLLTNPSSSTVLKAATTACPSTAPKAAVGLKIAPPTSQRPQGIQIPTTTTPTPATTGTTGQITRPSPAAERKHPKRPPVPIPFPWATDERAKIRTLEHLLANGVTRIRGDVRCKKCEREYSMEYDLVDKLREVEVFIRSSKDIMHNRAPTKWLSPALPPCRFCELRNGAKPIIAAKKRQINWLFLLLGQMLGQCTLEQLKYFCKHNEKHRTGAKDRLLYLTYFTLCQQLSPGNPLFRV